MLPAKMNFMSDPMNIKQQYKCTDCDENAIESSDHMRVCKAFKHLRTNIDWTSDQDCAKYFQRVMKLREINDKKNK